jgi:hypothetical protein
LILRYFTKLLKQRKNCEICADSSKAISIRLWDKKHSSFAAAISFLYIRNFANVVTLMATLVVSFLVSILMTILDE